MLWQSSYWSRVCWLSLLFSMSQLADAAPVDLCWSPNGNWLAYVLRIPDEPTPRSWFWTTYTNDLPLPKVQPKQSQQQERWQLWLMHAETDQEKLVYESICPISSLSWHPDGKTIACLSQPDKNRCELLVFRRQASPICVHKAKTDSPWTVWGGTAWHPNSSQLAASIGEALILFDTQTWTVDARKSNAILPAYAFDGQQIAFASQFAGAIWEWKVSDLAFTRSEVIEKAQLPLRGIQWSSPQLPGVPKKHVFAGIMWKEPAEAGFADPWTFKLLNWSRDSTAEPEFGISMSEEIRQLGEPPKFDWSGFDYHFDPATQQLWFSRPRNRVSQAIYRVPVNQPTQLVGWNPIHPQATLGQFAVERISKRVATRFGAANNAGYIAVCRWGEKNPRLPRTNERGRMLGVRYLAELCDDRFRVERLRKRLNFPELATLPLICRLPRHDEIDAITGWPEQSSDDESIRMAIHLARDLLASASLNDLNPTAQRVWQAYQVYFAYLAKDFAQAEALYQELGQETQTEQQRWQWLAAGVQIAIANHNLALAKARLEEVQIDFPRARDIDSNFSKVLDSFLGSMDVLIAREAQRAAAK